MSPAFSLFLDCARLTAALVVVASHLCISRFHGYDFPVEAARDVGRDAVIVFFLISGYVIAFSAIGRGKSAGAYAFDRASRIYTVVLPAVVLTYFADMFGARINPAAYDGGWFNETSVGGHLWFGLTLSNEWTGISHRIGTNGPLWSLSYEVAYYIAFGVFLFARGLIRGVLLGLCVLVFGAKALLLAPVWLLGVLLFKTPPAKGRRGLKLAIVIGAPIIYVVAIASDLRAVLEAVGDPVAIRLIGSLGESYYFLWSLLIGGVFAVQFAAAKAAFAETPVNERGLFARAVRWLAGGTFSLYVVHFPLVMLTDAALPEAMPDPLRLGLIGGAAILGSYVFAEAFERHLPLWRAHLRKLVSPATQADARGAR